MTTAVITPPAASSLPTPERATALELVDASRRSLIEATVATTPTERYAAAHLSALRAAAAVLALRGRPQQRRSRQVQSVWALLPRVAPELAEWSAFFAAGARKRAAAEVGIPCVAHREADDLVRDADRFLSQVCECLGTAHQPTLATCLRHLG